jgi:hypothetical protein
VIAAPHASLRLIRAFAVALVISQLPACHRSTPSHADDVDASAADTVRGTLALLGNEPMSELRIIPVGGGAPLVLAGRQSALLRGLARLDVMVAGRMTSKRGAAGGAGVFTVDSFVVRAADGMPAHDGIIAEHAGRFYLVVSGGTRMPADHLPGMLRGKVGARVFLTGPLDRAPASYGVIMESP